MYCRTSSNLFEASSDYHQGEILLSLVEDSNEVSEDSREPLGAVSGIIPETYINPKFADETNSSASTTPCDSKHVIIFVLSSTIRIFIMCSKLVYFL